MARIWSAEKQQWEEPRKVGLYVISGDVVEDIQYTDFNVVHTKRLDRSDEERSARSRYNSLCRSKTKLRRLINANVGQYASRSGRPFLGIFVTLTFAENVSDLRWCRRELLAFMTVYGKRVKQKLKWVAVPEKQERGAIHFHLMVFNLPFIPKIRDDIRKYWPHGIAVDATAVDRVDGAAAYVAKYISEDFDSDRGGGRHRYIVSQFLKQPVKVPDDEPFYYEVGDRLSLLEPEWGPLALRHGIMYSRFRVKAILRGREGFSIFKEADLGF